MKKVKILILLLLLLAVTQLNMAQQPDAGSIMSKSRDLTLTGSLSANIRLSITEKNGTARNRSILMTTKSYPDGLEKRFIKFLEPADVKGTAMLVIDNKDAQDDMWIYLPALKKTRRIISSDKGKNFMSSEFTNADMSSPTLSDFINTHLESSGTDSQWIIESKPVTEDIADEYGFSKKISYIDMDSYQIKKMEFYNYDNELFKTIDIKGIYPLPDGRFIVQNMVANNIITKRKSEIALSNITEKTNIDDSYFTLQNLQR